MPACSADILIGIIANRFGADAKMSGVEIGVSKGETSRRLLVALPNLRLCMVDAWATYPPEHLYRQSGDGHARLSEVQQAAHKMEAIRSTSFAAARRCVAHLTSEVAAGTFQDGELDWAFVDGDHTYPGAAGDLDRWYPKVRAKGLLCGHDFLHPRDKRGIWGVSRAVKEFTAARGIEFSVEEDVWWFVKPEGTSP